MAKSSGEGSSDGAMKQNDNSSSDSNDENINAASGEPATTGESQSTAATGDVGSSTARASSNSTNTGGGGAATNTDDAQSSLTPKAAPSVAALNVYKKVAIIRGSDDVLSYEETDGTVKSITDLHLAAAATTPLLKKPKPKDEIPVPTIKSVESYKHDIKDDYDIKISYVRHNKPSDKELEENLEYVIDSEDEEWLRNNTRFGGSIPGSMEVEKEELKTSVAENQETSSGDDVDQDTPMQVDTDEQEDTKVASATATPPEVTTTQLPLDMFEIMLDVLEKSTGFDMIVSLGQAQDIILARLPKLHQMYPATAPRNRGSMNGADGNTTTTSGLGVASSSAMTATTANGTVAGQGTVVTIRDVISEVYQYWMSKRSKLKRPLLRRFWPVTSTEDTNPHLVFRPREKEKYKLRKKRQNDMDAYRKMQQLKDDFSQIRLILSMIKQREELNRSLILLQKEWFEQKLYDAVDTSGLCRVSQRLDRKSLDELLAVETHYDVNDTAGGRRKKQPRRVSGGIGNMSTSISPVPDSSSLNFGLPFKSGGHDSSVGDDEKVPVNIAGRNHGEPAPNFLHPLPSRESYATSWEGSVPHLTTYVDSEPEKIDRFRHRPRIGRGGRIMIDRVPMPTDDRLQSNTYFTAGHSPQITNQELVERPKDRLLDLLPPTLDHNKLSRRIEDICLTALQEDYHSTYQAAIARKPGSTPTASSSGENTEEDVNDGRAVVVKMKDWLDTDDQLWGKERYAIGPI